MYFLAAKGIIDKPRTQKSYRKRKVQYKQQNKLLPHLIPTNMPQTLSLGDNFQETGLSTLGSSIQTNLNLKSRRCKRFSQMAGNGLIFS